MKDHVWFTCNEWIHGVIEEPMPEMHLRYSLICRSLTEESLIQETGGLEKAVVSLTAMFHLGNLQKKERKVY